jgi:DNA primase
MSSGIIAEIKAKLPVFEIVGESVALRRAGAAYKGLCPFHAERTPSFVVTPERDTWHCFGCGEHGDIFTFLMRRDGLEFREALRRLAERAGVELSERSAREDRLKSRLREVLETAIAWYREVFLQAHQAQRARDYLVERGLATETLERFGIGYAPNTWDALSRRLRAKGFSDAELIGAGVGSPSNRGGVYDRFRGRIVIPIRDASGRAIGLGGRIMPGADGPKYLNSPATPLFDKSRVLYGLDLAKAAIRKEKLAVIVEGYTDVMAAHQAGFANVVASLGTALTRGQVDLATRYADTVALAYDVDLAGEAATQRGLLEELGPVVSKARVVRVPSGKDPDEFIRTDPEGWRQAIDEARELIPYFMERAAAEMDLRGAHGRSEYARRMLDLLRRIPDRVERDAFVPQLTRITGIDERVLRQELAGGARGSLRAVAVAPPQPAESAARLSVSERRLLNLALRHPELATGIDVESVELSDEGAEELWRRWAAWRQLDPRPTLADFVASLDIVTGQLAKELAAHGGPADGRDAEVIEHELVAVARRVRGEQIEHRITAAEALIRAADPTEDIRSVERELHRLYREREDVKAAQAPALVAGERRS